MQPLTSVAGNIPAFLSKLWKIVNDPSTNHLIKWGTGGQNFVIENKVQFYIELLPTHYKHNNMSSFVRQLNMYGFHKVSSENRSDADKDELVFFHPYFKKGSPELLKLIKRKNTSTPRTVESRSMKNEDSDQLQKVLVEVTHLKGKQGNVDNQLDALKQENAVLWRELALLRQKHMKQQQIVNKLIQFLVTMVHDGSRMGGLGVKRTYPLMLSENITPKAKMSKTKSTTSDEGPTIHELESETLPDDLLAEAVAEEASINMKDDNAETDPDMYLERDYPITEVDELICEELPIATTDGNENGGKKVFLNNSSQDTLLSNLMNGNYNLNTMKDIKIVNASSSKKNETFDVNEQMTVATRDPKPKFNSVEDMDMHVETTESELNQLKELLNGYTSFDANALLGLFNDESPEYHLSYETGQEDPVNKSDPLVSGSELATYEPTIDYSQLFNDSSDEVIQPEFIECKDDSDVL